MSFDQLGLISEITRAVKEHGYVTPTAIQAQSIPLILQRKDLLGGAQTGTGKTASFMLPLLQLTHSKIKEQGGRRSPKALILVPTRELAAQVHESIRIYGKYLSLKSAVIYGGVAMSPQTMKLRRGVDIIVATPGRLLDHINRKNANLSSVDTLVLDEADCMLDMGFIHDIRKIIEYLPEKRQNLLFSATFSGAIGKLAEDLLNEPEKVEVARRNTVSELVEQVVYPVDRARKSELLTHLILSNQWKQVLVFTRTKHGADKLSDILRKEGIRTDVIHGDKSQAARAKALLGFKKGNTEILIGTDVAARGLDINQLPRVINFELPTVPNDYIHRIGRTGRAGNKGEAISLVCVDERKLLREIEQLTKTDFLSVVVPGFEIDRSIKAEPIRRGRFQKRNQSNQKNFPSKGKTRFEPHHKKGRFSKKFKKSKTRR